MLGSISIAVNSITGPAMLTLPATFIKSGIVPTIATLVLVGILCSMCSLHLANVISKLVPHNRNFQHEIEFSQAFHQALDVGHTSRRRTTNGNTNSNTIIKQHWYLATQFLFWGCITCLNSSAIVDTAQVVDTFVGHGWSYGTVAVVVDVNRRNATLLQWVQWDASVCDPTELLEGECLPFAEWDHVPNIALITFGKVLVTLLFLPLSLLDLKDNVSWQVLGFFILLVTSVQFVVQFAAMTASSSSSATTSLTWWGHDWDDLLGVVLFNFPLVLAIPAWLYEREPHVDVTTVVHCSTALSVLLYACLGWMGARALPHVSENMIESMMSGCWGPLLQWGATLFTFAIVGLNIPLFSVLMRLNLMGNNNSHNNSNDPTASTAATSVPHCSRTVANLAAVYVPFGVAWLLHGGDAVTKLLSYGGVGFTSLVAFILPLVLALHVANKADDFPDQGSINVVGLGCFGLNKLNDKAKQYWEIASLRILLSVAILSVLAAIFGIALD